MEARIVQSLLARNRFEIWKVEGYIYQFKTMAGGSFAIGDTELAHKQIKWVRRQQEQLAKLVEIQKSLKKALHEQLPKKLSKKHKKEESKPPQFTDWNK